MQLIKDNRELLNPKEVDLLVDRANKIVDLFNKI